MSHPQMESQLTLKSMKLHKTAKLIIRVMALGERSPSLFTPGNSLPREC